MTSTGTSKRSMYRYRNPFQTQHVFVDKPYFLNFYSQITFLDAILLSGFRNLHEPFFYLN
jgi:hypothetical protein